MATKKKSEEDIEKTFKTEAAFFLKLKNPSSLRKAVRDSVKWYTGKVGTDNVKIQGILAKKKAVAAIRPGQMLTFKYESKLFGEGKLDHFDRSPLIIFLGYNEDGNFLGLNVHYIPPKVRAMVFSTLLKVEGNKKMRADVQLKVRWKLVKSIAKYKPLKYAIKAYRPDFVRSKTVRIPPAEYRYAVMLPYADFVGATAREVWRMGSEYY